MTEGGLSIRRWRRDDAHALVAAWTDSEIARWNPVPADTSLDAARRWIEGTQEQNEQSPSIDMVMVDGSDAVVGEIGLRIDHENGRAEVGFWLGSRHRGLGFGTELLAQIVGLAARLSLRQVFAVVGSDNAAAIALLDSAGWPEVATTTPDKRAFVLES